MQMFEATRYRGKRVRFSAQVKSEKVTNWCGLWMRVDGRDSRPLAFDNMQDRSISGTTSWKGYQVVLDVPEEASYLALGLLLDGVGQVWMSDVRVEVVDKSVAATGRGKQVNDEPTNLNFTN
jgi:hypothetical protein